MATQLQLQKVLNFKQNFEVAFKTYFQALGFSSIFISIDTGDIPDDMMEIAFDIDGSNGINAAPSQTTGTGANEEHYYTGTLNIKHAVLRLNDNNTARTTSDPFFTSLIYELSSKIKYGMLNGSLFASLNGITPLALPNYDLRVIQLTSESYGTDTDYVKDVVELNYKINFSIKKTAWTNPS
jgi:hypothetical protein